MKKLSRKAMIEKLAALGHVIQNPEKVKTEELVAELEKATATTKAVETKATETKEAVETKEEKTADTVEPEKKVTKAEKKAVNRTTAENAVKTFCATSPALSYKEGINARAGSFIINYSNRRIARVSVNGSKYTVVMGNVREHANDTAELEVILNNNFLAIKLSTEAKKAKKEEKEAEKEKVKAEKKAKKEAEKEAKAEKKEAEKKEAEKQSKKEEKKD